MTEHLQPGDVSPDAPADRAGQSDDFNSGASHDERADGSGDRRPGGFGAGLDDGPTPEPSGGSASSARGPKAKATASAGEAKAPRAAKVERVTKPTAAKRAASNDDDVDEDEEEEKEPAATSPARKKKARRRRKKPTTSHEAPLAGPDSDADDADEASPPRASQRAGAIDEAESADDEAQAGDAPDDEDGEAAPVAAERKRKKRRSRRRSAAKPAPAARAKATADADDAGDDDEVDSDGDAPAAEAAIDDDGDDDDSREAAPEDTTDDDAAPRDPADAADSAPVGGAERKRRRRGSRGGRRRKTLASPTRSSAAASVEAIPGEEDDLPEAADEDQADAGSARDDARGVGGPTGKKRRRRRKRPGSGGREGSGDAKAPAREKLTARAADDDYEDEESADGENEDERESTSKATEARAAKRGRRGKKKAAAPAEKSAEELAVESEHLRTQTILVNAVEPEEKRVAVIEGERIVDLLMTAESQKTLVNDVYRGKVVNLEPAIGAAFIDFGQGRNGFLHTSDVLPIYGDDDFKLEHLLTARVDLDEWGDDDRVDPRDLHDDDSEAPASDRNAASDGDGEAGDDEHADDDAHGHDGDDDGDSDGAPRNAAPEGNDRSRGAGSRSEEKSGGKSDGKQDDGRRGGRGRGGKELRAKGRTSERRMSRDRRPITDLLRVGDPVVVQITKDAIGDKGPTLTTYISIPGRYLVLMPSMSRTGVSRKIPDEKERRRLKKILAAMDVPTDMGVIVRTAGVGKKKEDLARDLDYLLGVWEGFGRKLRGSRGPSPLYQESDVATRTLRDLFSSQTKRVVVDDYAVHEQMCEFAGKLLPEHVERIELYDGERPIFHQYGIEQDFEKVFSRRVDLPSGGSIVFDQAEALVAIDVNSGRTRTDSFDFEKIALKTNLEAVAEIALQIRLRDLGGIIVCDFIDMVKPSSNRQVERTLRDALENDRARSKLGRISQFGLLEMTRQRLGPGTHKKVFQACPRCRGTGRVRTMESRAQAILRRLGSALSQKGFATVEVKAHPEVVQYLKEDLYDYVRAMEHRTEREIRFIGVADQSEDSVLNYLRADGREVRPGGRRKR